MIWIQSFKSSDSITRFEGLMRGRGEEECSGTWASPPCAPTPGHRIHMLGAAALTAVRAGMSVAPATRPTHTAAQSDQFSSVNVMSCHVMQIEAECVWASNKKKKR